VYLDSTRIFKNIFYTQKKFLFLIQFSQPTSV
jgi:hypothetical protein